MLQIPLLDKLLILTLVFLTSISIGYFPIFAGISNAPENANPTKALI